MDSKKLCTIMEREVASALQKEKKSFPDGSGMSIIYKEFSSKTYKHVFEVTVTGIKATFLDGVGFAMTVMFDALERIGFIRDENRAKSLNNGDTMVYTYLISNECAEKLLNPWFYLSLLM